MNAELKSLIQKGYFCAPGRGLFVPAAMQLLLMLPDPAWQQAELDLPQGQGCCSEAAVHTDQKASLILYIKQEDA